MKEQLKVWFEGDLRRLDLTVSYDNSRILGHQVRLYLGGLGKIGMSAKEATALRDALSEALKKCEGS